MLFVSLQLVVAVVQSHVQSIRVRVLQQRVLRGQFSVLHVHDQEASRHNRDQQNEDGNADHDSDGREALKHAILFLLVRRRVVQVDAIAFRTVAHGVLLLLAFREAQVLRRNFRSGSNRIQRKLFKSFVRTSKSSGNLQTLQAWAVYQSKYKSSH